MVDTTCAVSEQPPSQATQHPIGLYEAVLFWLKLGFISFGGPIQVLFACALAGLAVHMLRV